VPLRCVRGRREFSEAERLTVDGDGDGHTAFRRFTISLPVSQRAFKLGYVYMKNSKFQNYHIKYVRHMHEVLNLDEIIY